MLSCAEAARRLLGWEDILVLSHASPDGDTLGSAAALLRGLTALGKRVGFYCADPVPEKYRYLFQGLELGEFAPQHVVTVDVADVSLLGDAWEKYGGLVHLAIDHHATHRAFTEDRWVEGDSAAAAELIYLLLGEMGVSIDPAMAGDIYTGLTTDTGCFRYRSVTPRTHRIAAAVMELGADAGEINRLMFESKSKAQVEAERLVMEGMEFFCGGRCAMVQVPRRVYQETGATESELEGVAAMPRQIEGVVIGVTLKEKEDSSVKASVRMNPPGSAADLCAKFGGGGHQGAAGCSFPGKTMAQAAREMKCACQAYLAELEAQGCRLE